MNDARNNDMNDARNNDPSSPADAPTFFQIPDPLVAQLEESALQLYESKQYDRAAECLRMVVQLRPQNVDAWCLLGVTYRYQKLRARALQALQRAVELDSSDKNALINLGEALCEAGKIREGVDLLRGVFDMGFDPALAPEAQDYFTRRAGMQLAVIKEVLEVAIEGTRARAEAE